MMEVVFKIIGVLVWIAIIAIPLLIVGFLIFFLVKMVFLPNTEIGRKKKGILSVATVLNKRQESCSYQEGGIVNHYYITFLIDEKEQIEFKVSNSEYNRVNFYDKGNLSYTGDRFNYFSITEKSNDKTKGKVDLYGRGKASLRNDMLRKR